MSSSIKVAVNLLLVVWLQGIFCQTLPKLLSSPVATAKQDQPSHAVSMVPMSEVAAAPSPPASEPDYEHEVLQLLGWQQAYDPTGYPSMQSYHPTAHCRHGSLSAV